CGDITYIKTWDGWAYLATVIDLHSRKVVGWSLADHMRTSLVTDALEMAITHRNPSAGVIFHSDRGCQYTSTEFDQFCRNNNIRRSLGRTGICYDNAVSESFFATYKKELIHTRPWPTIKDLISRTFDWIESYYNRRRRHSTLGYLTPGEYELGYRDITELAA
ncbi:IS3 family transposase, partial [Rhodococcus sp. WS4]